MDRMVTTMIMETETDIVIASIIESSAKRK